MPRILHLALALSFTLLLPSSAATVTLGPATEAPPEGSTAPK